MADKLTPERRSWNMSRIRGKNTKPELLVRKLLHAKGYRYRLHGAARGGLLPGRPDLVFASRHKVIFVNGCFWHFHDCRVGQHAPKANAEFWETKRSRTRNRDAEQHRQLENAGWQVLIVWECELKDPSALEHQLDTFLLGPGSLQSRGGLGPVVVNQPAGQLAGAAGGGEVTLRG